MDIHAENKPMNIFILIFDSIKFPVLGIASYAAVKAGSNFMIMMGGADTIILILKCATLLVAPLKFILDYKEKIKKVFSITKRKRRK